MQQISYDLRNLQVLIVDDSAYMRKLLKAILRGLGIINVREASDGADALQHLRTFSADFVVVDWRMEPVDGLTFVPLLRTAKDSPNRGVPIIMMTGHTEQDNVEAARTAGVNDFLAKPISALTIYQRIIRLVERGQPATA
ncbi:MAG: response regulator [Alphaproteobacteria bacterium]|nr:response regulator [Alphaproteobacteria bacterium]